MIQRHFKLALTAGHSLPLVINANQYDSGEQWLFTLYNDGVKYIPSTGAIVGIKADRLGIINTGTVDANGRVVINETRQMTAAVGKNIFELLIDDQTHGTANFMVLVEPRPGDNADLSESDYSLFEEAIQGTSQAAIIAGVQEWMDDNLTDPTTPIVDASLTLAGAAADAKKTGDEISSLKSAIQSIQSLSSIPAEVKQAMDTLFSKMAVKDDESYMSEYQVFHTWATAVNVVSISAVYTQSGTVYDTDSLDSLKPDLVVTAHYSDGTTATVTTYTLSGALTSGTSIITVTYEGKTTTFNVTVTEYLPSGYTPIEYVWTNGNSQSTPIYVQTGVTATGATSFEYKVSRDTLPNTASGTNSGGHICSSGNGFYAPFVRYFSNHLQLFFARADGTGVQVNNPSVTADTPFEIKAYRDGTNDVYLNGTKVGSLAMGSIAQSTTLRLFNYGGDSWVAAHLFVGKLYYMNIYENDVLIREYVPCKNSNNVVGLYDRVNHTFVGSATSYPLSAPTQ